MDLIDFASLISESFPFIDNMFIFLTSTFAEFFSYTNENYQFILNVFMCVIMLKYLHRYVRIVMLKMIKYLKECFNKHSKNQYTPKHDYLPPSNLDFMKMRGSINDGEINFMNRRHIPDPGFISAEGEMDDLCFVRDMGNLPQPFELY